MNHRRLACVRIAQGTCIDAVQSGHVRVDQGRRGEIVICVPREAGAVPDARKDPVDDTLPSRVGPSAASAASASPWEQVRLKGAVAALDPSTRLYCGVIGATAGPKAVGHSTAVIHVTQGETLLLSTIPLVDSRGERAAVLSREQTRQMVHGPDAQQAARQLAGLLLGRQPDVECLLIVYTVQGVALPNAVRAFVAVLGAGMLSIVAFISAGVGRVPDEGFAVLLSGEARSDNRPYGEPLNRLEGIAPGHSLTIENPAVFGFSSRDRQSGLDSFRLFTSEATRLDFLEIDRRRGKAGDWRPLLIGPSEGDVLLLRRSSGRQACFVHEEFRICSAGADGMAALGASCVDSTCTWSCLAGSCLFEEPGRTTTLPAPSNLGTVTRSSTVIPLADMESWDNLCGDCLGSE